jgi:hypothetical protein
MLARIFGGKMVYALWQLKHTSEKRGWGEITNSRLFEKVNREIFEKFKTVDENGLSEYKKAALKAAKTRKETVLENGLTNAQDSGRRGYKTRKETILENGMSVQELIIQKTKEKLSEVGEDGLTGYQRKGRKTSESLKGYKPSKETIEKRAAAVKKYYQSLTPEEREKYAEKRRGENSGAFGRIWIKKGRESISIKQEELEEYLNDGWVKGKTQNNLGTVWMTNGVDSFQVEKDRIEEFLNKGFRRGRIVNMDPEKMKTNLGKSWYHNDKLKICKTLLPEEVTKGWVKGRKSYKS